MQKLEMKSKDIVRDNIEKIAALFPNVITEAEDEKGQLFKAVDFELLKQELSDRVVDGDRERYQLTWPGKNEAIVFANMPTTKTLRPVKEDSVDWDNTENLYIEGDNLEVLKILQESYLNKIKCIYIDPPYNTGKDFVYKDNFKQSREEYLAESGQVDDDGNRLFQNTESNGRFHSDWLSMMYPRLKLAKNLLREDGVIFISIDDNEVHNLRKICDEVFGERNFVANVVWQKKYAATNDAKGFSVMHDHLIVYQKSAAFDRRLLPRTEKQNRLYRHDDGDGRGLWRSDNLLVKSFSPSGVFPIKNPNTGEEYMPPKGSCWRGSRKTIEKWLAEGRIFFGKDGTGAPQLKRYLNEVQQGRVPTTWWTFSEAGHNDAANKELKALFKSKAPFDTPKPSTLIKKILMISSAGNDIILDFFSGSATTAHAVMQLNAGDGGNRKYIMVQLPEPCPEDSEAYKAGFKNISEIGKERIRRAAQKIKEETGADIDYGFRVFKADSSNMKDVYYWPEELTQQQLIETVSNIKEDRTGEDLLVHVMLEWGLELSLPMKKRHILGKEVHSVAGNSLVACFDEGVSEELVREIAKEKPLRVVFRDSSFVDDAARINVEELFKMLSPATEIKVI
jgi:adenine-specific DNA-methyltransferase